ncbi:hypothetical protein LTR37_021145 [Vermiconidia calcicola]|uniref:Uncharacterized protein n=1 Tax=Vermiconidia calcicola TaxID=1690605 RepID=A0ACC3MAM2_9PEZI|nr:hypothetical protein LTR37_021145 [Vermiconidia calcicola]
MIGADIPSYYCTTAEVSLGPVQEEIYTRLYREKFGAPDYFVVEPDQPRPIDLDKHLEAYEPEDDLQVRKNADRARSLMHDLSGENDNGFGFFYYGTNLG